MALVRNDVATSAPSGYGPSELLSAYNLTAAAAADGAGTTVVVADAYDDPNAIADFSAYRAQYGLPACDTTTEAGCLTKVNQSGSTTSYPAPNTAWAAQESMDVDMVAAICPQCHVVLAEAADATEGNLEAAARVATSVGAHFVTLGFGVPESASDTLQTNLAFSSLSLSTGIALIAAAGDSGYGVQFPASSQNVTSVGGTSLNPDTTSARGWSESVWAGTGSGCSAIQFKPSWQADSGCTSRTANDVAAVADPETGVAFYDTYQFGGWGEGGGTNVSSAIIAGVYALANGWRKDTLSASYPYRDPGALNQVTSGSDGTCTPAYLCAGGPGYNGPAGLGTPNGIAAFAPPTGNVVTVFLYSNTPDLIVGNSTAYINIRLEAVDTAPGAGMTPSVTGQPAGMNVAANACSSTTEIACLFTLNGSPGQAGVFTAHVNVTDSSGATATAMVPLTVTDVISVGAPLQEVTIGQPLTLPVNATSAAGDALNFAVAGLPPGLSYSQTGPDQITVTGTPTTAGQYTTTVTATNPLGGSRSGTITWWVYGTISLPSMGNLTSAVGSSAVLNAQATDSVSGAQLSYSATGLPPGVVQQTGGYVVGASPLFGGWPTKPGTYGVTISAYDNFHAVASESFTWTVTSASGGPTGPVRLNLGGKCLDGNGTKVQIWTCNGGGNQNWKVAQDWTLRIHGLCLTETGTKSGSRVVLASCNGGAAQQWEIQDNPNAGAWVDPALTNVASGRCLDDTGKSTVNGTVQEVWSCDGGQNQTWVTPAGPLQDQIQGMCLADPANATANGTRVVLWQCNGWKEENWTFEPDGTIRIHGKCLDDLNDNGAAGTPVVLETCNGSKGENWGLYAYSPGGPLPGNLMNAWNGDTPGVPGNTASNGTPVQMWGSVLSQTWRPL